MEGVKAFLGAAGVGSDLERPGPQVSELCVGVELPEAVGEESGDEETCVATAVIQVSPHGVVGLDPRAEFLNEI